MLVDEVFLSIKGGHGGPGKVSFYPGEKSGPSGGNGGRGGSVFIQTTTDITALKQFLRQNNLAADAGDPGQNNRMFGKDGKDLIIYVPVGSVFIDVETEEEISFDEKDMRFLICKGGLGGKGNYEFKSSTKTTPKYAQPGLGGEVKRFKVSLKLIADFGLIGLPNAGKSSLLNALTETDVKTADYPFTTLEPNLGVLKDYTDQKILADIPGLIEGASLGKGLGIKFLKHIEKTTLLIHCIDASSEDVLKDYETINNELKSFNSELVKKDQIIVVTKTDLVDKKTLESQVKKLKKTKRKVYTVSIHDWDALEDFKKLLLGL